MQNTFLELKHTARKFLKKHHKDTPFFIYDLNQINQSISLVKKTLNDLGLVSPKTKFFFSLKSNPNATLVRKILDSFDGVDISSERELEYCITHFNNSNSFTVSGPAKTNSFLIKAIAAGVKVIHIDSENELREIERLCSEMNYTSKFSLRLNVDENSSKLGMGVELINRTLSKTQLPIDGIHFYLGREKFSNEKLKNALDKIQPIYEKHFELKSKPMSVFIGPGLTTLALQENVERLSHPLLSSSLLTFHFEMGRVVLEASAIYCSKVLAIKDHEGANKEVIINGGIQHLSSTLISFNKREITFAEALEKENVDCTSSVNVYGSLCLPNDLIFKMDRCPIDLQRGDWLVFYPCGAYNLSASAYDFIMQDKPEEFLLADDQLITISN